MEIHIPVSSVGISTLKTKWKNPRNRLNKTECINSLFIAKQGVEQKLSLFVKGGNINLKSLEAWERKPINKGQ